MSELVQESQVLYWRGEDDDLNFGDALTELLLERALIGPRIRASRYRLIGSIIDARNIGVDLAGIHDGGVIAYWGCGARDDARPPAELMARCEFYGVRGPLSRELLGLPPQTPMGDTGLLAPLLRPAPKERTAEALCIPHYYEPRSDEELLALTGADRVLRPRIGPSAAEAWRLLDEIARAGFVLAGALHGAVVAHAYATPFAFFDAGHLDIPFKWRDFAASIDIPVVFVGSVADGRRAYADFIERRAQRLPLSDLLAVSPYYVRPSILLAAAEHDGLARVPAAVTRALQELAVEAPGYAADADASLRRHDARLNARFAETLAQLAQAEAAAVDRAALKARVAELEPVAAREAASAARLATLDQRREALEVEKARIEGRLQAREEQLAFERDAARREIEALERDVVEAQGARRATETELARALALAAERLVGLERATAELADSRAAIAESEAALAQLRDALTEREGALAGTEAALAQQRQALAGAEDQLAARIADTEERLRHAAEELAATREAAAGELEAAREAATDELAALREAAINELATAREAAADELAAVREAAADELAAVREAAADALASSLEEAAASDRARSEAVALAERNGAAMQATRRELEMVRAAHADASRELRAARQETAATADDLEAARAAHSNVLHELEVARRQTLEAAAEARLAQRSIAAQAPLALALARLAARRRDWPAAERGYAAVLRARPGDVATRVQYGHALKEQGELALAAVAYGQAWLSPLAPADLAQHLAHALRASGQFGEAERLDAELRRRDTSNEAWSPPARAPAQVAPWRLPALWSARLAARRRQWPRAARRYQQLLASTPGALNLWMQLGHALKESGQPRAARAAYLAALHLDPSRADTHLQLGHLMKVTHRLPEAGEAYRRALELNPGSADARRELESLARNAPASATAPEVQASSAAPDPAQAFAERNGLSGREARLLEALRAAAPPAAE